MYKLNKIVKENNVVKQTYRYKFSNELINLMKDFSTKHKEDDKDTFDTSIDKWFITNNDIIERDFNKIKLNGYEGDLNTKLYNSIRYYYCKRTETKKVETRRKYIKLNKELLDLMDNHIIRNIQSKDYKPSNSYKEFCINNKEKLVKEFKKLNEESIDETEYNNKIKKTFNNRYYTISKKIETLGSRTK